MIGKVKVTSTGYDPEKGKPVRDLTLEDGKRKVNKTDRLSKASRKVLEDFEEQVVRDIRGSRESEKGYTFFKRKLEDRIHRLEKELAGYKQQQKDQSARTIANGRGGK